MSDVASARRPILPARSEHWGFAREAALPALALSLAFHVLNAALDSAFFDDRFFAQQLLRPSARELWARVIISAVLFVLLAILVRGRRTSAELARFARAVEEAQDGIQLVDLNGRVTYSNQAMTGIVGLTPEDLQGQLANELKSDPSLDARVIQPELARSGRWEGELLLKHRDGGSRSVWLATSIVNDRTGRPSALLGIFRDVTARKRSEATLLERERLAALGADVGAALVQEENLGRALGRCTDALVQHLDATFARIWTVTSDESVLELQASSGIYTRIDGTHARVRFGENKIGQIAQSKRPALTNEVQRDPGIADHPWAIREGLVAFAGYPLVVKDRLVGVMAMFSRKPLGEETLKALGAVANATSLGIERSQAHEALRESEQRFRRVFEDGPMGMSIIDRQRSFVRVNKALCKMVGYSETELVGRSFSDITHPDDRGDDEVQLEELFADKVLSFSREKRYLRKDKEIIWARVFGSAIKDKDGKATLGMGIIEDITARKHAADALREAKDRAEAADRTKSEFLDIASHELRTPLTALRLQVQHSLVKLEKGLAVDAPSLHRIQRQTGRLIEMVNDLLDASRLERGRLQLHAVPLDLCSVVSQVSAEFRERAPRREIAVALPPEPALVEADPARIEQVIANFLDNALKYSPDGSPVGVSLCLEPDQVRLSVTDRGLGIPPEQRAQLFNRFFRVNAEASRQQPGLGLGLYICRMIIKPHGGTIGVDSEVGHGCTFHFTLPRRGELR